MFPTRGNPLPFSPVLLAGIAARPLPPVLLQPFLDTAMAALSRCHPRMFDRLSGLDNPTFLIDPTDLPLVFLLEAVPEQPKLKALRQADERAAAVIRGPLMTLINLAEGRLDGDALFFSRGLVIEGDTEAVVALRNAVDDSDIDLAEDILSSLGPFAVPVRRALELGRRVYARMSDDLDLLKSTASPQAPEAQRETDRKKTSS